MLQQRALFNVDINLDGLPDDMAASLKTQSQIVGERTRMRQEPSWMRFEPA